MTDIRQTFSGKTLFCTGVTGFLGKVLLFKVLKEFPDVEKVYCLCRAKKNVTMQQRFDKEVLSSPCFHPLMKEIGQEEWKRRAAKVVPISGDLTANRLGLSPADYATLNNTVQIIIHLAATVDFNEKLNVSVNMNVLGSVRVLALAQRCHKLLALVHTSTAYVNFPHHGGAPVLEQVYPIDYDAEAMAKYIMTLHEKQIPHETTKLLKRYGYPNTYTFTKNLTEHILVRRRGNVPLAIVRPSIVGAAWREPVQGWVDALTSAGGIFLTVGLGVCHELVGNLHSIADVIPVDHVVNILIKAAYKTVLQSQPPMSVRIDTIGGPSSAASNASSSEAQRVLLADKEIPLAPALAGKRKASPQRLPTQQPSRPIALAADSLTPAESTQVEPLRLREALSAGSAQAGTVPVYHATTSATANPLCWETIRRSIIPYWANLRHPKAMGPPSITFYDSFLQYNAAVFFKHELPLKFAKTVNRIPGFHSDKRAAMLKKYERAIFRCRDLNEQFHPFVTHTWRFECMESTALDDKLNDQDRRAFSHDVFEISWHHYAEVYSWGLMRFIMKEDRPAPKMPLGGSEIVLKAFL